MTYLEDYYQETKHIFDLPLYMVINKNHQYVEIIPKKTSLPHRKAIAFCSNDALNLAQHPKIIESACDAIKEFGASASSSVALMGYSTLYQQLENLISDFKGMGHTSLFLNAWMGMKALFEALCYRTISYFSGYPKRNVLILCDSNNHSCIVDTLKYVKGVYTPAFNNKNLSLNVKFVRTCQTDSLKKTLNRYYRDNTDIIYVADAVFSMDGNILPLPQILEVLGQYPQSTVILDGAHATGCIGKTGRGILEHFSINTAECTKQGIDFVIISTLSKFGASCGGSISTNCRALNLLMEKSVYYTNTSAIAPPLLASAIEAIQILKANPQFVQTLHQKTAYARQKLQAANFHPLGKTNIIPIIVSNQDHQTKQFAISMLEHHQIWVSSVFHVASPRLRTVINRVHTHQDIDQLIDAVVQTRHRFINTEAQQQEPNMVI